MAQNFKKNGCNSRDLLPKEVHDTQVRLLCATIPTDMGTKKLQGIVRKQERFVPAGKSGFASCAIPLRRGRCRSPGSNSLNP